MGQLQEDLTCDCGTPVMPELYDLCEGECWYCHTKTWNPHTNQKPRRDPEDFSEFSTVPVLK